MINPKFDEYTFELYGQKMVIPEFHKAALDKVVDDISILTSLYNFSTSFSDRFDKSGDILRSCLYENGQNRQRIELKINCTNYNLISVTYEDLRDLLDTQSHNVITSYLPCESDKLVQPFRALIDVL